MEEAPEDSRPRAGERTAQGPGRGPFESPGAGLVEEGTATIVAVFDSELFCVRAKSPSAAY